MKLSYLKSSLSVLALSFGGFAPGFSAYADEGMWLPDQVPHIAKAMKKQGLGLKPSALSDLMGHPMGAIVSLGGCTASFVSDMGLVVTNHHCAYGSIQYNSTAKNNLIENGFYAKTVSDELQAAPGSRISVTTDARDVTKEIVGGLAADMDPKARYQAIDDRIKKMVADCEIDDATRCAVSSFHGGLQYYLTTKMTLRDVRLVYAPPSSIGKYGGDVDNWMWPRHTGDFSFYRAYVGPDGKPADFAKENVPFAPKHHLKVQAKGVRNGDFVMAAGYPGRTSRYRRVSEIENAFNWRYPLMEKMLAERVQTIEAAAPKGSDARVKYASALAGLNNYLKNIGGQMEGARKVHLTERKAKTEAALNAWIASDPARTKKYQASIRALDELIRAGQKNRVRDLYAGGAAARPALLGVAKSLYRLSLEQQKPDEKRESGFQERDMRSFVERMNRMERRYDPAVDRALWELALGDYAQQTGANRLAELDAAMNLSADMVPNLDAYYADPALATQAARLAWMDKTPAQFEASDDPFLQLAVALSPYELASEEKNKIRAGKLQSLRPLYMEAIIAFHGAKGKAIYPDANSTLRITYGNVLGGSPQDGLEYKPFTTLEGILAKNTGIEPFNSPKEELALIAAKDYGAYALKDIGSVPVDFLANLDITGGNSGSPALNAKGELVGLLFDGTYESINSDWDFDVKTTRSIQVDVRYMLWVMEKLGHADRLLVEMGIH